MPTAVVTGAGQRLGRAMALALAQHGFDVVLHAFHSTEGVRACAGEIEALGRQAFVCLADLSTTAGQDQLVSAVQQHTDVVDVLVHNAANFLQAKFADISREQYRQTLGLNLEAPFFVTQGLLPQLQHAAAPHVIHIVDAMYERPWSNHAHYGVSKGGLATLTRILARELGPHVRVNGIGPGSVALPPDYSDADAKHIASRVPLQRLGDISDVVQALLFLVQHAPYMSGQIICVDGGRNIVP